MLYVFVRAAYCVLLTSKQPSWNISIIYSYIQQQQKNSRWITKWKGVPCSNHCSTETSAPRRVNTNRHVQAKKKTPTRYFTQGLWLVNHLRLGCIACAGSVADSGRIADRGGLDNCITGQDHRSVDFSCPSQFFLPTSPRFNDLQFITDDSVKSTVQTSLQCRLLSDRT